MLARLAEEIESSHGTRNARSETRRKGPEPAGALPEGEETLEETLKCQVETLELPMETLELPVWRPAPVHVVARSVFFQTP